MTPETPSVVITADMHTHTLCSDGVLTPAQLVERAELAGYEALAITDHDTMAAHHELRKQGYNGHVRIIPGMEVSCYENGRDVHVLAYFCDLDNADLLQYTQDQLVERLQRASGMVDRLHHFKQMVALDEVVEQAAGAPIGRPHIAAVMVRRGMATTIQNAFDVWLDSKRPAYVARNPYSVHDAVTMIRAAGGFASIAHPMRTFADPRLFLQLVTSGIIGVEVFHPAHQFATREYYRNLAKQHGLLVTGGSDYHGTRSWDERNFGKFGLTSDALALLYEGLYARGIKT